METIQTYEQAEEYLFNIPKFTGKNSLSDTKAFLKKMGNPEKSMKVIHVAGTNGKGSVCAYLCSILQTLGYTVGSFTSPHLVELRERIQINRVPVKKEELLNAFRNIIKQLEGSYHPSFFEFLFFMALDIFADKKPDYVILETGLGGQLDSTNAVERPQVSVITRIGMDHMQYLGDTIEQIAGEKAGIIKEGGSVVYSADVLEASQVIVQQAKERISLTYPVSKNDYTLLKFKNKTIDFFYHSRYYDYVSLSLDTIAFYQMENASLALRAAEVLFRPRVLTPQVMKQAIFAAHWEGRMEEVAEEVYVDGAHNEDGIKAFLDSVRQDACNGERFLIFSAVSDKAYERMLFEIAQSNLFSKIAVVGMDNSRALTAEELSKTFYRLGRREVLSFQNVCSAYEKLAAQKASDDRIYIAGSLYMAGEFKSYLRMRGSHD